RLEHRKTAVFRFGRFIRNRGDLATQERLGHIRQCGEMQIGEQNLARTKQMTFRKQRFFNLQNQLSFSEYFVLRIGNQDSRLTILIIAKSATQPRRRFEPNLMSVLTEGRCTRRRETDAIFMVFDFLRDTDHHKDSPFRLRMLILSLLYLDTPSDRLDRHISCPWTVCKGLL